MTREAFQVLTRRDDPGVKRRRLAEAQAGSMEISST
jgi:hypothetical protein